MVAIRRTIITGLLLYSWFDWFKYECNVPEDDFLFWFLFCFYVLMLVRSEVD